MDTLPIVSIINPCRNEEKYIGLCLESILANDYPKDRLEVLVVDGMSEDGTREIVEEYVRRYSCVRLLDNPKKITSAALNIGIRNAKGDFIMWMSAHNRYEKHNIARSVEYLLTYPADNVGGIIKTIPREETLLGKAIAACLSHRFGVGNSLFRVHITEPQWVDTVFGGCYRREVFDRVGLFNENLLRGQDMEFNLRLKKAGGRILLAPDIVSYYYARSDMKTFWKHNWNNGLWAILPFLYSPIIPVSWRHLVPLAFILTLFTMAVLAIVTPLGSLIFLSIVVTYVLANFIASTQVAIRQADIRFLFTMPVVFGSLHLGYGLGSLWGAVKTPMHLVARSMAKR